MNKTLFIACNILRKEEDGQHVIIGSGANGEQYFLFEISREIANELATHMELEIITVKNQKTWQKDQENAAEVNAVALQ